MISMLVALIMMFAVEALFILIGYILMRLRLLKSVGNIAVAEYIIKRLQEIYGYRPFIIFFALFILLLLSCFLEELLFRVIPGFFGLPALIFANAVFALLHVLEVRKNTAVGCIFLFLAIFTIGYILIMYYWTNLQWYIHHGVGYVWAVLLAWIKTSILHFMYDTINVLMAVVYLMHTGYIEETLIGPSSIVYKAINYMYRREYERHRKYEYRTAGLPAETPSEEEKERASA